MSAPQPLMLREEVAAAFRVDPRTVARWARTGKVASFRTLGGHRRYFRAEIDALLAGRPLTAEQVRDLRARYAGSAP